MDQNELPLEPHHLGVPSVRPKLLLSLWYLWRNPCTSNGRKWASTWASSRRSTIGCIQNYFWPYGTLEQTMHLSCTDANSVFKRTKTRFDMTHVTKGFHRVHPKWFLSLWYVQRNASRLALSPNSSKRASTWASTTWSTMGCVQNDF
jgi:hypothetical protein